MRTTGYAVSHVHSIYCQSIMLVRSSIISRMLGYMFIKISFTCLWSTLKDNSLCILNAWVFNISVGLYTRGWYCHWILWRCSSIRIRKMRLKRLVKALLRLGMWLFVKESFWNIMLIISPSFRWMVGCGRFREKRLRWLILSQLLGRINRCSGNRIGRIRRILHLELINQRKLIAHYRTTLRSWTASSSLQSEPWCENS